MLIVTVLYLPPPDIIYYFGVDLFVYMFIIITGLTPVQHHRYQWNVAIGFLSHSYKFRALYYNLTATEHCPVLINIVSYGFVLIVTDSFTKKNNLWICKQKQVWKTPSIWHTTIITPYTEPTQILCYFEISPCVMLENNFIAAGRGPRKHPNRWATIKGSSAIYRIFVTVFAGSTKCFTLMSTNSL